MTRHTHRPTSPAGRLAAGRALRAAAALLLPLGLLSACSVDLSSSGSEEATAAQSASAQAEPTAQEPQDGHVSVGPDGVSITDGSSSVSVGTDGIAITDGSGSTGSDGSTGSGAAGSGASSDSGTATDCSWLDEFIEPTAAITTGSDTHLINESYATVRIANDLRTLTVSAPSVTVVATNVDNVVINNKYATVYVCNVESVTVNSNASSSTIVWGPGVVPAVQDFAKYTTVSAYTEDGDY